jgi:hypothetical protein
MDYNQLAKEKEAGGVTHQPQIDRAATLRLGEEYSSGAAELQDKVKVAAKKLVELDDAWVDLQPLKNETVNQRYYRGLEEAVHCIPANGRGKPATVFFRLEDGWLKITEEHVTEAFKSLFPGSWDAEGEANYLLKGIREVCKDLGKVSWHLPAIIRSQEGSVA